MINDLTALAGGTDVEQITTSLERELRFGSDLLKRRERFLEQKASAQARAYRGAKAHKALGKHLGSIPEEYFFALQANPDWKGCWEDRSFVKDFFKRNTHLRSSRM